MFGLAFRFPAGRYHATPWGRNVNEADVAWPPEPWRILRALIACYWRKGDRERWSEDDLAGLMDALAEELPVFHLPEGGIHAHTRHYMPIRKGKDESLTLVFDAFVHVPDGAEVQIVWKGVALDRHLRDLASDLASGIGYLGRAESWTECRVMTEPEKEPNCRPAEFEVPDVPEGMEAVTGERWELCRLLAPRSAASWRAERESLLGQERDRIRAEAKQQLTESAVQKKTTRSFLSKTGVDTLPARLVDALSVDTADLQSCRWDRPPAGYEAVYARHPRASPGVVARSNRRPRRTPSTLSEPTVARFLLAGRPRPRIEDAVKIGEVMRAAALSRFGWDTDPATGKRTPRAPWEVSGRDSQGRPLRSGQHRHAFWLPEDADDDGWIDHVTVFIAAGMNQEIRSRLDRITRIWMTPRRQGETAAATRAARDTQIDEWRLALEGFGHPDDFDGGSRLLAVSKRWRSVTPFLASGHLKKAGYAGEVARLLKRRGMDAEGVTISELKEVAVAGTPRRALNFHRFRSRGRERQPDPAGALLQIEFPEAVRGPLALGYSCHFGLGVFGAVK